MSLFVLRILYDIGIYKKCAVAAATLFYGTGYSFCFLKSINCEEKFWLRKGYTTHFSEEDYKSELTNHTTKINKLESWKKEIDDSIFRLNHFQNIDKAAGLVGYSKCESIVLIIGYHKYIDGNLSFENLYFRLTVYSNNHIRSIVVWIIALTW